MRTNLSYTNILLILVLLGAIKSLAQPVNDNCSNAQVLCEGTSISGTNIGASIENCTDCEDDFNFCFTPAGTVWYQFFTNNTGGDVNVSLSNLLIETNPNAGTEIQAAIIQTTVNCQGSSYSLVGNCIGNATADFSLNATNLPANTNYFVVIGGNNIGSILPAGANFDISISGSGVQSTQPTINIATDSLTVCDNLVVNFNANSNCQQEATYNWFVDGNLVSSSEAPNFQTGNLIDGNIVTAEIICGANCPNSNMSNELIMNVLSVDVDAGMGGSIINGETFQLQGSTGETIVGWTPPTSLSDPSVLNPIANPEVTTTYTLTVTDGQCESSDEVTVIVIGDVAPTNLVTPNGDNINDFWEIENIERYPNCQIYIYDRWGQIVFDSRGYTDGNRWDGNRNGKKLAAGTYYYVIELNDNQETVNKGFITLIR